MRVMTLQALPLLIACMSVEPVEADVATEPVEASPPDEAPEPAPEPEPEPEPALAVTTPAPAVPEAARESPADERPLGSFSDDQIRWVQNRWSGVGVGYDNGLWGSHYGQTLKLSIPFGRKLGRFFGLRVRGGIVHYDDPVRDRYDPVLNVGGELFGRSPVWAGVLRVYGGGGLWAGIRPNPSSEGSQVALGGGGHFGLEAFAAPFMSFTFEVGGQAPGHSLGIDSGGSAMGGLMFYFGRNETRWNER
jgi:hypothetical protein